MTEDALATTLTVSTAATYVVSVGMIVLEFLILRAERVAMSRRGGHTSIYSGILAFGGLGVANRLVFVSLMFVAWDARSWDLGLGIGAWITAIVAYDCMFYVAHRAGHRIRLLWCFHAVHHTSEEMRLTSAIRGSAFDFMYLPWFFIWIPILGIHPSVVLIVEALSRLWGVLTHVHPRFVHKLGWVDRVVVTPSVHRVHHGRNPLYIDRNYGEILIIWDYLFGSYQAEEEEPDYGVLAPVDAGDLMDVQFSAWQALWQDVRGARGLGNKFRTMLGPPGAAYGRSAE